MTRQIPNFFTLLNLLFGCLAIVFILQNGIAIRVDADGAQFIDIPEKIWLASLFIGLAALVDFLDGFVARFFKTASLMGKELDSLADLVSFGVAPSMIIYQLLRMSLAKEQEGIDSSIMWLLPAFIYACCGAWRLARFNLDETQSKVFKGVPIPAAGLVIASLPLIYWSEHGATLNNLLTNKWVLYLFIAVLSWLMISHLPMMALKFTEWGIKNNLPKIILLAAAIPAVLLFHWLAVPLVFMLYIILSLSFKQPQS